MDAARALQNLMDGNGHYAAGDPLHVDGYAERRLQLVKGQKPFAAILSCADSRVPPEIIFGQGLGDLFVVRVAGNTVDPLGLESLGYAVRSFGTRLIIVLGHDQCGAVSASVKNYPKPDVGMMLRNVYPAVAATAGKPGDHVSNAITENVMLVVKQLKDDPMFLDMVKSGKLTIMGGRYDLQSGRVKFFRN